MFSITLFCSAMLMFCIQPLAGKWLLPIFGGTPQVWNTCMIFFQAILFVGYMYVHFAGRLLGLKGQAIFHGVLIVIAAVIFPISLSSSNIFIFESQPEWGILKSLWISLGAPLFIISCTAPLLQKWFSQLSHTQAKDPYFLYATSNLGSLIALLAYPILIEPNLGVIKQKEYATILFSMLGVSIVVCLIIFLFGAKQQKFAQTDNTSDNNIVINWNQRVRWLLLSFAPSSLLLGVTTHITTDIAAVPLFWIIPLALYLLTFIFAFAQKSYLPYDRILELQAFLIALVIIITLAPFIDATWGKLILQLLVFFTTAFVCHRELANCRPSANKLTEFYLWLSFGGALGGAFNALLAPIIFIKPIEYPLALTLACLLRPFIGSENSREKFRNFILPLAVFLTIVLIVGLINFLGAQSIILLKVIGWISIVPAGVVVWSFCSYPLRFGFAVGLMLIGLPLLMDNIHTQTEILKEVRSFFGIYKVNYDKTLGINIIRHGTTTHGAQKVAQNKFSLEPLSYYHRGGPFGDIFSSLINTFGDKPVAVVGLGAGTLSCYGREKSQWTFYEIDSVIEEIAKDTKYFTYLRDCPPQKNIVIGDARLKLEEASNEYYEVLIIDAFSSDAIPTHLLTKEAFKLYLEKISPTGVLILHISNRYLNLEPVIGNLASAMTLSSRIRRGEPPVDQARIVEASPATVVILAREEKYLGDLVKNPKWNRLATSPNDKLWTDDYVNILSILEKPSSQKRSPP